MMYYNSHTKKGDPSRYNDYNLVEVRLVEAVSKSSAAANLQAKYDGMYQETLTFFCNNDMDVDKLSKEQLCVLLWKFNKLYRPTQKKFHEEPGKPRFDIEGLRVRLRKAMKADHSKLAVKSGE